MQPPAGSSRIHVFVSYSHVDQRWLNRLKVHLIPLAKDYDIDSWEDTRLTAGSKWRSEIQNAIKRAHAAILIVSADFLASEFIRTNELPPLLKAAEEEGVLILPIIASPSLFLLNSDLSQFQAINNPSSPLVSATEGEREAIFVRVAEALIEKVKQIRPKDARSGSLPLTPSFEDFLEHSTWSRLIKIGDWIFDGQRGQIIGAGIRAYLLSREEYGERPFAIKARLEFTNFDHPSGERLGMNAGIVFGWKSDNGISRYYNILLTGDKILVERIGFRGGNEGQDFQHISETAPLPIQSGETIKFEVRVDNERIQVFANDKARISLDRPTGVVGRVGLRPWRSKIDCTAFTVVSEN